MELTEKQIPPATQAANGGKLLRGYDPRETSGRTSLDR